MFQGVPEVEVGRADTHAKRIAREIGIDIKADLAGAGGGRSGWRWRRWRQLWQAELLTKDIQEELKHGADLRSGFRNRLIGLDGLKKLAYGPARLIAQRDLAPLVSLRAGEDIDDSAFGESEQGGVLGAGSRSGVEVGGYASLKLGLGDGCTLVAMQPMTNRTETRGTGIAGLMMSLALLPALLI